MPTAHAPALAKVARSARRLSANTVLLLMAPIFLAPVIWTVVQSFLPGSGALKIPPVWVTAHPTIANYSSVFNLIPFLTFLFNSVKITLIVTFGSLVTSALAAYAFARLRFPGRNALFFMFLAALMVPNVVTAAPTYVLMHSLHLATSQTAVWLPGLINVFGIFLLRQFFRGIPATSKMPAGSTAFDLGSAPASNPAAVEAGPCRTRHPDRHDDMERLLLAEHLPHQPEPDDADGRARITPR